ncbi:MAG: metal-dependent hydrolase [Planctomycetota bacterium]
MPSIITHGVVAAVASRAYSKNENYSRILKLSLLCSILPDADVVAFKLGIPYYHYFGHRGFFHSPFFGLLVGLVTALLFFRSEGLFSKRWWLIALYFFLLTASHGILDAFTNGGLGIALLIPFDDTRIFMPWQPIVVSPIGIKGFFSEWGVRIMLTEILWIWTPLLAVFLVLKKIFPGKPSPAA